MVRRLVQHQKLRLRQEQSCKAKARLFTARQQICRLRFTTARKSETCEHALNPARPRIAARILEAIHQARIRVRKTLEFGGIIVLFRHFRFHFAQAALHFAHRLKYAL